MREADHGVTRDGGLRGTAEHLLQPPAHPAAVLDRHRPAARTRVIAHGAVPACFDHRPVAQCSQVSTVPVAGSRRRTACGVSR